MQPNRINSKVKLNFASPFQKPLHAIYEDEVVKVSHVGDAEGMSAVVFVIDSQGQSAWVPQAQVTIVDPDYLPTSPEALASLTSTLRGTATRVPSR